MMSLINIAKNSQRVLGLSTQYENHPYVEEFTKECNVMFVCGTYVLESKTTINRAHAQTIKMTYVTKAYRDQMCLWKRGAIPHVCLLCKKETRKHFVQLKTVDFNDRRIPLMLRLIRIMTLVVKSTSAKNVPSEIYTGALLEHAWHTKKIFCRFFNAVRR